MAKIDFYQPNWRWGEITDKFLEKKFRGMTILNFPCGKSRLGIRADIDPSVKPDVICDLRYPPFKSQIVDVLICDPPKSMFGTRKWINRLSDLPKKHLLLWTPYVWVYVKHFKVLPWITIVPGTFFIRLWLFFTRKQKSLEEDY